MRVIKCKNRCFFPVDFKEHDFLIAESKNYAERTEGYKYTFCVWIYCEAHHMAFLVRNM